MSTNIAPGADLGGPPVEWLSLSPADLSLALQWVRLRPDDEPVRAGMVKAIVATLLSVLPSRECAA